MAGKGGARPGAGRKRGSKTYKKTKRQKAVAAAQAKANKVLGEKAFDGDAHAFMCMVYKDTELPLPVRLDAAQSAAPYEKARLTANTHSGPKGEAIPVRIESLNDRQIDELVERLTRALEDRARNGESRTG